MNRLHPDDLPDKPVTVGQILSAMDGYPGYLEKLLQQIQQWLTYLAEKKYPTFIDELYWGNGDYEGEALLPQISWVEAFADLMPSNGELKGHREAVVLGVGYIDFENALRMAIDHGAIFGRGRCSRIWLVTDSWITAEVCAYLEHIKVLRDQGIDIRAVVVTPWGWTEVPLATRPGCFGRTAWTDGRADGR
ncbi:hypothetical protein [Thermanaerovibrio acidaminovorans]|jgi:hypothetical protein|uniref:hypothetical protein n=1 Tax=Thermanaerovibrio acidaminovorans TaxID=81462 RepID=UPI00249375D3|nr:hypothetical protein [Thermanaerovibrio acidaminovorans]